MLEKELFEKSGVTISSNGWLPLFLKASLSDVQTWVLSATLVQSGLVGSE